MPVLFRYIAGAFVARLVLVLLALTLGVQLFDMLANAGEVISSDRIVAPMLDYAMLRLPRLASMLLPLATLLATLFTLVHFMRYHELVVMRGAGVSIYQVVAPIAIVAVLLTPLHFLLSDQVVSETAQSLRLWQDQGYRGRPPKTGIDEGPAWIAVADTVVNVGEASVDGRLLLDVTIIERTGDGGMHSYTTAARAVYRSRSWQLYDVERLVVSRGRAQRHEQLAWDVPLSPGRFASRTTQPAELTYSELNRLLETPDKGNRPPYFYSTWLYRKFTLPLSSVAMVLIAAPLGLMIGRRPNLLAGMAGSIAAGFLFFIFDNVILTLGESGVLPAQLAAWVPILLFSSMAISFLVHVEG